MNCETGMPLVTVGVKCYNNKEYIGDALKSVLHQTYHNIEVLVIDDGSTDGSDVVVQELLEKYKDKGGVARFEKHSPNRGNVATFEHLARLAQGELLIQVDGDDISAPDRVEKCVEKWLEEDKRPATIITGIYDIDLKNRVFGQTSAYAFDVRLPVGAAMAWNPKVVTQFPECLNPRTADDGIMVVRALYFAPIAYVDEPLVYHRVGSGVSTALFDGEESERRCVRLARQYYDQWKADLLYMKEKCSAEKYAEMRTVVDSLIRMWDKKAEKLESLSHVKTRFAIFCASLLKLIFAMLPGPLSKKLVTFKGELKLRRAVAEWHKTVVA